MRVIVWGDVEGFDGGKRVKVANAHSAGVDGVHWWDARTFLTYSSRQVHQAVDTVRQIGHRQRRGGRFDAASAAPSSVDRCHIADRLSLLRRGYISAVHVR